MCLKFEVADKAGQEGRSQAQHHQLDRVQRSAKDPGLLNDVAEPGDAVVGQADRKMWA